MKRRVLCLILAAVCLLGLTACGASQKGAKELAACKAALADIQSRDSCYISVERHFEGESVLNDSSRTEFWQSGENWLSVSRIPSLGAENGVALPGEVFADLHYDGRDYTNFTTGVDENGKIIWNQADQRENVKPWLLTFQWDDGIAEYVATGKQAQGRRIQLRIHPDGAEPYNAEFYLDESGALVTVQVETWEQNTDLSGNTQDTKRTEFFWFTPMEPDQAQAEIDREYQRAVKQN